MFWVIIEMTKKEILSLSLFKGMKVRMVNKAKLANSEEKVPDKEEAGW